MIDGGRDGALEPDRLKDLVIVIAAILGSAALISFVVHLVVDAWPYARIFSRVAGILAVFAAWRKFRVSGDGAAVLGLGGTKKFPREAALGFAVGIGAAMVLVGLKVAAGSASWNPNFTPARLAWDGVRILLQALAIAIAEEVFFRGYLTGELLRAMSRTRALVVSSAFFSAVHFLRPLPPANEAVPEFIGLFLIGIVLAQSLLYTGRIYQAIGFHASLVYVTKMDNRFVEHLRLDPVWAWGTDRIVTCPAAWVLLALLALLIFRKYSESSGRGAIR